VRKFEKTSHVVCLEGGYVGSSSEGDVLGPLAEGRTWEGGEAGRQGQGQDQEDMESTSELHGEEILGRAAHASYWEACSGSYMGAGVACAGNAWEVLGLIHALKGLALIPERRGLVHGQIMGLVAEPLRIERQHPFPAQEESYSGIRPRRIDEICWFSPGSLIFSIATLNNLVLSWEYLLLEDLCATALVYPRYFEDLRSIHIGIGTAAHDRYTSYHTFVNLDRGLRKDSNIGR
jgi:hypothetical protein